MTSAICGIITFFGSYVLGLLEFFSLPDNIQAFPEMIKGLNYVKDMLLNVNFLIPISDIFQVVSLVLAIHIAMALAGVVKIVYWTVMDLIP